MTELRVSREEAREGIERQIAEGEELIEDKGTADLFEKKRLWTDYNVALLRQLFSDEEIVDELAGQFPTRSFNSSKKFSKNASRLSGFRSKSIS